MTSSTAGPDTNYERLRAAIVRGEIAPNSRLVESDVVTSFDMTRAAVRDALIRLEQEGLVVREPHRGARVRQVTDTEALQAFRRLSELEGIIPALESAHAIAWVLANEGSGADLVCLSGRGDKDLAEALPALGIG